MSDQPRISIVTVTRNAAPLLEKTIVSVASQSYPGIEYIVVDGASTDGTTAMLKKNQRVGKWISEPDRGIYDAMNKGARMATGEWILFMNAGDTFCDITTVDRLAAAATTHRDADVIYGDVIRSGKEGNEGVMKAASDVLKGHRLAFCHQSVMVKRMLQVETPFDISHKFSADFKFFKILAKKGYKFVHVHFPVAVFDVSGLSTKRRSGGLADNIRVVAEVDGLVKGAPSILHLLPSYLSAKLRGK